MKNEIAKIEFDFKETLNIFQEPKIAHSISNLFAIMHKEISNRFNAILKSIDVEPKNEFKYNNLLKLFKFYFYKQLVQQAINMALMEYRYNLLDNILSLINEKTLKDAIYGDIMLQTFISTFRSIEATSEMEKAIVGSKIINLKRIYYTI